MDLSGVLLARHGETNDNIAPDEVLSLETLRLGLRSDTIDIADA